MDGSIEEWNGISPVVFTFKLLYPPVVITWHGVKFYLMASIVEGKVLIFAGADGSEEVRNQYNLEVSV